MRKEIKFGKKNGKNAAAVRSILDNGCIGDWFHIAVSEAKRQIKVGTDINGIKVMSA